MLANYDHPSSTHSSAEDSSSGTVSTVWVGIQMVASVQSQQTVCLCQRGFINKSQSRQVWQYLRVIAVVLSPNSVPDWIWIWLQFILNSFSANLSFVCKLKISQHKYQHQLTIGGSHACIRVGSGIIWFNRVSSQVGDRCIWSLSHKAWPIKQCWRCATSWHFFGQQISHLFPSHTWIGLASYLENMRG